MRDSRITIQKTVLLDQETGNLCSCQDGFWKTCPLRVANRLPCVEALISITPIERDGVDPAPDSVRTLDKALSGLEDGLRGLQNKLKI